jgi:hypothetical protein
LLQQQQSTKSGLSSPLLLEEQTTPIPDVMDWYVNTANCSDGATFLSSWMD